VHPLLTRVRGFRKWLSEVLVFVIVLSGVHLYRTQDMLNANNEPAPPLTLTTLDGAIDGLDESAGRPTLVYFFAPWCHFCAASAHNIRNLRRIRDEEDLNILLVALDWQTADEVREYVTRHELDLPVLLGTRETSRHWGVSVFPTYYILDGKQQVAHRDYGYSTLAGLWLRSMLVDSDSGRESLIDESS
jgi:thiol-disulfide isomerase/thioredoxin